jgi:hypothetical protein
VSAVAIIVLVVVALLLLAMLIAGGRRAAAARLRASHDAPHRFRSHAEASRRSPDDAP